MLNANGELFVFHFRPIENYPPVQNFLQSLKDDKNEIVCITTQGSIKSLSISSKIKIKRYGKISKNKVRLWFTYVLFNISSIYKLIIHKPQTILYYESLSSLPVYFYKKIINKKARVFIHYHEYLNREEYQNSSSYELFCHKRERFLYDEAEWISHTNMTRLEKFLNDQNINFNPEKHHFLPNYPLSTWGKKNKKWKKDSLLKIVYVGYALDEESNFTEEFLRWISRSDLEIQFDIYLINRSSFSLNFIREFQSLKINVYDSIPYNELPEVLSKYHVGVILYRALTDNPKYCAPNKLFEYLQCGLDVWYADTLQGMFEYDSNHSPQVIRLDMSSLGGVEVRHLLESKKGNGKQFSFEETYSVLFKKLLYI